MDARAAEFDAKSQEAMRYYVYALFDPSEPRLPFYIGKGKNNRAFDHARGALVGDDQTDPGNKIRHIRRILRAGKQVHVAIVRWDMTEEDAFLVEAGLIDMFTHTSPGLLTNVASGHTRGRGWADASELQRNLAAEPLPTDLDFPVLLVKLRQSWPRLIEKYGWADAIPERELYEAARGSWHLKLDRAKALKGVLGVADGLVRVAFVPTRWRKMPGSNRIRATGDLTDQSLQRFVGKSVNGAFGGSNSVQYLGEI